MAKSTLRTNLLYGTSFVAAMMVAPTAAFAGTADSEQVTESTDDSAAQEASQGSGLTQIVVTARRREESVQTIPVSVQAISAEEIQQRDLTSLEKIAASTPNFTIARASNGAGAQIMHDLGFGRLRVLGTPRRQVGVAGFGLEIVEYVAPGGASGREEQG